MGRIGCRMINLKGSSFSLRIAASFLLCIALLSQVSSARSWDTQENESCTMSLARMKSILSTWLGELGQWTEVTGGFQRESVSPCWQRVRSCEKSATSCRSSSFI